ncbi:hypothetical protein QUF64_16855 [Anaerolineales bacterium HSG6]|nr:hypothetical protein [Anaerolineales bacterium HSG6]
MGKSKRSNRSRRAKRLSQATRSTSDLSSTEIMTRFKRRQQFLLLPALLAFFMITGLFLFPQSDCLQTGIGGQVNGLPDSQTSQQLLNVDPTAITSQSCGPPWHMAIFAVIFIGAIAASIYQYRCPACNGSLGRGPYDNHCQHCGVQLEE